MIKKRFHCLKCGNRFWTEVFEDGEAEARKKPAVPVKCPECNSTALEKA